MTLATRTIHKIDGVDISDGVHFATNVPEVDAVFGTQALFTDMQARAPVFNRAQPVAGRFTFQTASIYHTDAERIANLVTLRALVAPGIHTYTLARPGEADTGKSVSVYFDAGLVPAGGSDNDPARLVVDPATVELRDQAAGHRRPLVADHGGAGVVEHSAVLGDHGVE